MRGRRLILLLLAAVASTASGETVYVTDVLRLGLHEAADTSDRPFQNLASGSPLEVLERTSSYLRVRTGDGLEGWVKAAYIVDEKPARARLAELEAEIATLRGQLGEARNAALDAAGAAERRGHEMSSVAGSADAMRTTLERLKRDNESYAARLDSSRGSVPLTWAGAALLVALVAGFAAGLWWLDALIRRRHGGFRVY